MSNAMKWKTIESPPGNKKIWEVCNYGLVRVDGKILKEYLSDKGYSRISFGKKTIALHRLIALTFLPNPNNFKEVNHKNGVKTDNNAGNLEWCTRSQNMKHAYDIGLHPGVILRGEKSPNWKRNGDRNPSSKPVRGISKINGKAIEYRSQRLAEQDGFNSSKISLCVNGKKKSHGGYIWSLLPLPPKPNTINNDKT